MTFDGSTEEEIAHLKRSKLDFEKRCKEQEEELDEQAGQIQVTNCSFGLSLNQNYINKLTMNFSDPGTSKIASRNEPRNDAKRCTSRSATTR